MGSWMDTPDEILTIILIASALLGALVWLIRSVGAQARQMKPNHGHSLRDAINRIESRQLEQHADIRELRDELGKHADRMYTGFGKVHVRIDDHIAGEHLRRREHP